MDPSVSRRDEALSSSSIWDVSLVLLVSCAGFKGDDQTWIRVLSPLFSKPAYIKSGKVCSESENVALGNQWYQALSKTSHHSTVDSLLARTHAAIGTAEDMRRYLVRFGAYMTNHGSEIRFNAHSYLHRSAVTVGQLLSIMNIDETIRTWKGVQQVYRGLSHDTHGSSHQNLYRSKLEEVLSNAQKPSVISSTQKNKNPPSSKATFSDPHLFEQQPNSYDAASHGSNLTESLMEMSVSLVHQGYTGAGLDSLNVAFIQERRQLVKQINDVTKFSSLNALSSGNTYAATMAAIPGAEGTAANRNPAAVDAAKVSAKIHDLIDQSMERNFALKTLFATLMLEGGELPESVPPASNISSSQLRQSIAQSCSDTYEKMILHLLVEPVISPITFTQNLKTYLPYALGIAPQLPELVGRIFFEVAHTWWNFGLGNSYQPYMDMAQNFLLSQNEECISTNTEIALYEIISFAATEIDVYTAGRIYESYRLAYKSSHRDDRDNDNDHGNDTACAAKLSYFEKLVQESIIISGLIYCHDIMNARHRLTAFKHNNNPISNLPLEYRNAFYQAEVLLARYERRPYQAFALAQNCVQYFERHSEKNSIKNGRYNALKYTVLSIRCLLDSKQRKHHIYADSLLKVAIPRAEKGKFLGLTFELGLLQARFFQIQGDFKQCEIKLREIEQMRYTVDCTRLECEWIILAGKIAQDNSASYKLARCSYTEFNDKIIENSDATVLGFHGPTTKLSRAIMAKLINSNPGTVSNIDDNVMEEYCKQALLLKESPADTFNSAFIPPPEDVSLPVMSTPAPSQHNRNHNHQQIDLSRITIDATPLAGEELGKRGWPTSGSPQRPESKRRSLSFGELT